MRATHAGVPLMQSAHSSGWQQRVDGGDGGMDGGAERSICRDTPDPMRQPCVPSTRVRREPLMQACHSCSRPIHLAGSNERVVAMGGWTAARSQASVVVRPIRRDGSCVPSTRVRREPLMQACHLCSRPATTHLVNGAATTAGALATITRAIAATRHRTSVSFAIAPPIAEGKTTTRLGICSSP